MQVRLFSQILLNPKEKQKRNEQQKVNMKSDTYNAQMKNFKFLHRFL